MKRFYNRKLLFCFSALFFVFTQIKAQSVPQPSPLDTIKKDIPDTSATKPLFQNMFTIALDMRVRTEWRHGYKSIPTPDTTGAFEINQRTRLNLDYRGKNLDVYLSLQDARVWGQQDARAGQTGNSTTATPASTFPIYFFEAYAELFFNNNWSVRLGRQRVQYDNQRLFAENNWRLAGNSHDAIRLIYNNKNNFTSELLFAFNQSGENIFTTKYQPVVANYKDLLVNYLHWKMNDHFILTTINAMDGYQSSNPSKYTTTYQRFTLGGRVEVLNEHWYATLAGYNQIGKDSSGKKLAAYYLQPEIKYTLKNFSARLGMEYFTGEDSSTHPTKDYSFAPLYGLSHDFLGNLDIFDVPADFNYAGMVNPYLNLKYENNKIMIRMQNHLLFSQSQFVYKEVPIKKYLGFENDWRFNYKPNKITDLEFGFCWAMLTNSASVIKKSGDSNLTPVFAYVSLYLKPTLGKIAFN